MSWLYNGFINLLHFQDQSCVHIFIFFHLLFFFFFSLYPRYPSMCRPSVRHVKVQSAAWRFAAEGQQGCCTVHKHGGHQGQCGKWQGSACPPLMLWPESLVADLTVCLADGCYLCFFSCLRLHASEWDTILSLYDSHLFRLFFFTPLPPSLCPHLSIFVYDLSLSFYWLLVWVFSFSFIRIHRPLPPAALQGR